MNQVNCRHANSGRPKFEIKDEYDVQDLMYAILRLHFTDVRKEEVTPSNAGSSARMDFLLKSEQIVIETKMTRASLKAKKVGEELMVDIGRYKVHPDCKYLLCFVYDPEKFIDNPPGLENDLSGQRDKLTVKVLIVPKGT